MDPITISIMAALGLGKGLLDKDSEGRQLKLAAATQRYSPWTGLKAGPVKEGDPLGSMVQGGVQGAMLSQVIKNAQVNNDQTEAMTNWLNHGGSPTYPSMMAGMKYGAKAPSPWTLGNDYSYTPSF